MALLPPVVSEIVHFGVTDYPRKPQRWPEHLHAFHQFDAVLAGEVFLDTEDKPFRMRRGDAILLPPMVRHAHRTRGGFRVGMFKFRVAPPFWPQLGTQALPCRIDENAMREIESAGRACREKSAWHAQQSGAALTLCLVKLARMNRADAAATSTTEPADAFHAQVWNLLERVEANPYRAWSVAALARECHLTPDHFAKRFREALGQTPLDYLLHARMRSAAQELTADPGLAIKEVAAAAGYATVHAFTRAFTRVMGASPARFRHMPTDL